MSRAPDPVPVAPRSELLAIPSGVELHLVRWEPSDPDPALPPALLVHGLASNARLWDGVARSLAARGHRVVALDQRGHGRSSKPDVGYDVATVADDLAHVVRALGWQRPVVAGQSWGGNVVVELAHRHPDLARAIVAVDGGFIDLRTHLPRWEDALRLLAPPRLAGAPFDEVERMVRTTAADWPDRGEGSLANFEHRPDGTVAPWLTYERHLIVLRGLWEHDPAERFATITTPVLFVVAEERASWTVSKRSGVERALARLEHGAAAYVADAHHDVHAQHPELVAALVHDAATGRAFTGA